LTATEPGKKIRLHTYVDFYIYVELPILMNSQEFKRLLAAQGCTFGTHKGGGGHMTVRRGDRKSQLPTHGCRKEFAKGLVNKILKKLELK
jgi:mRNA interferase HicA